MSAFREAIRDLPEGVFADVFESEEAYLVVVDVPGAGAGDVTVEARGRALHVEAMRSKSVPREFESVSEGRSLLRELTVPLPPDASGEGASATVGNGVLELRVPKAASARTTEIPVTDG